MPTKKRIVVGEFDPLIGKRLVRVQSVKRPVDSKNKRNTRQRVVGQDSPAAPPPVKGLKPGASPTAPVDPEGLGPKPHRSGKTI
jgi:hypothetical protein